MSAEKIAPPVSPSPVPAPTVTPLPPPSDGRGVEAPTTLTRYMAQLRHHPPITREQERSLAKRWSEDGDRDAGQQLVLANLRLVVKIAMEYKRAWANTLDLIQEGNLGLLEAVQRFDIKHGTKLSTYASYWIRAFILKWLIDNIRLVKLSQTRAQRKLFFRLNREKRELEREGFRAEPKLLAERLDVDEADVVEMETRLAQGEVSMDAPLRGAEEEDGARFGDFLATPGQDSERVVADESLRRSFNAQVAAFTATLEAREQRIMEARVLAEEPVTLRELGAELGVTRERVRQLEARLIDQLREYLRENVVDFEYYAPSDD